MAPSQWRMELKERELQFNLNLSRLKVEDAITAFNASMMTNAIMWKAQDKYFAEKYKRQDEFHEEFMG